MSGDPAWELRLQRFHPIRQIDNATRYVPAPWSERPPSQANAQLEQQVAHGLDQLYELARLEGFSDDRIMELLQLLVQEPPTAVLGQLGAEQQSARYLCLQLCQLPQAVRVDLHDCWRMPHRVQHVHHLLSRFVHEAPHTRETVAKSLFTRSEQAGILVARRLDPATLSPHSRRLYFHLVHATPYALSHGVKKWQKSLHAAAAGRAAGGTAWTWRRPLSCWRPEAKDGSDGSDDDDTRLLVEDNATSGLALLANTSIGSGYDLDGEAARPSLLDEGWVEPLDDFDDGEHVAKRPKM